MTINQFCLLCFFSFLGSTNYIHSYYEQGATPTSLVLFTLQDNQITLERYSLQEIKPGTVKLSSEMRKGHTLYKICLSPSTACASSLFFYPADQQYLVILTKQEEQQQQLDLLLSWAPLITQHVKQLAAVDTVDFSIEPTEHQETWVRALTCPLSTEKEDCTLSILFDTPVQAACGAFVADSYFNYDKGLFSRTFDQNEVETLGLLTPCDHTIKTRQISKELRRIAGQTVTTVSYYAAAGISAGKALMIKSIACTVAIWNNIKQYFVKRRAEKKAQGQLQKSLDAEAEFDQLLEETMNADLDFIPKEKPAEPNAVVEWIEKAGTYLLMRYISLEQKVRNGWNWIWNSKQSKPTTNTPAQS